MRRITLTIVTTVAILVLLFSYRTSRNESATRSTVAVGQAHLVTGGAAASVVGSSGAGPDPGPTPQASNAVTVPTAPSQAQPGPSQSAATTSVVAPGAPTSSPPATAKAAAPTTSSSALSATVDGASVATIFGDIQVEVVIAAGKITDVKPIVYPDQLQRDQEINGYALPQLRSQVLAAQSANVAGVGGATYTSQGYLQSVQSALDQVHFH